jgi:hypothetical protein
MKRCALLIALAGLCIAGGARKTFTGVIHDNRCVGPNCATQCPINKGPVYTLQSGDDAWLLSYPKTPNQKSPAQYVGKKVIVTGTPGPDNKLNVTSIVPAE